ncbi:MAG: S16 family serine protease [Infirmifilum sp.]
MRRILVPLLLILIIGLGLISSASPYNQLKIIGSAWILAPAVTQTETGYAGSATNISVFITEGWGDVYVSTYSLTQEDFQGAATAATRVISNVLGVDFNKYNFYFKVQSDAVIVGGPSAGVAMAVVVYSALTGKPINRSIAVTGMISPDGTVGPVGGVYEKAQAMASSGVKVFLVPPGESVVTTYKVVVHKVGPFQVYSTQPVTINLTDYALKNWNLRVVEVSTIEDALHYFFNYNITPKSITIPYVSSSARSKIDMIWQALEQTASLELYNAKAYVNQSTLTSFTKSALVNYLNTYAQPYIQTARQNPHDIGTIPLLTSSIAISRWIKLLVDYSLNKNIDTQVSSTRENISKLILTIQNTYPRNFQELNYLVIAGDLAIRASRLFNDSAKLWSQDPQTALQNLAYATALVDEAKHWINGLPVGATLDARQSASTYLSIARSTWPYVYAVLSQTGYSSTSLDLSSTYYSASVSLYGSGYYVLASIAAARSIALAESSMLDFQGRAVGSPVYLEVSSTRAQTILSSTADLISGIYFYNQSRYATTDADKLAYLKLASELASLTLDLAKGAKITASPPKPVEERPQTSIQPTPQTPPQGQGSLWDKISSWLHDLYLKTVLYIDNIYRFLKKLIGR